MSGIWRNSLDKQDMPNLLRGYCLELSRTCFRTKVMLSHRLHLVEVTEEFFHPSLSFANTDITMELDIYVPRLRLAFEYQVFLQ